MVHFLAAAQMPSGEFPYLVATQDGRRDTVHFQCFQYNAFQCIDLVTYFESTGDSAVLPIITRSLEFLRDGVGVSGQPYYDCSKPRRAVTYHAAALGAALAAGTRVGIAGCDEPAQRAYSWLLAMQRHDGGFPTSLHDYRILSDRRSYPRNQSMILCHLLSA
jgi:hypothetical protein